MIDLAKMILASRERYRIQFKSDATKNGPKFFQCKSDGSTWLSRDEAVAHVLKSNEVLEDYYSLEEVDIGEPRGNFAVIALCGMSGEILGPPNHHEYQMNVARLHAARFSSMPLERFKSRITMAKDEETIEKWKQQVSKALHYRLKSETESEANTQESEIPFEEDVDSTETESEAEEASVLNESEVIDTPEEEKGGAGSEAEEPTGEVDGDVDVKTETDTDTDTETNEEPVSESETETEPEIEPETAPIPEQTDQADDALILKTPEELRRHFLEHFASEEIAESHEVFVPGNVSGNQLARGLLELLKRETEKLRRGFPLPMIQSLCRELETRHLRFFKRGKKALHVSSVRPKALDGSISFTDRIQKIVDFVAATDSGRRRDVVGLLESLVPGFERPQSKEEAAKLKLNEESKSVLTDLRWLTSEGYVLEFPDTRLALGKRPPGNKQKQIKRQTKVTETKESPPTPELIEKDDASNDS